LGANTCERPEASLPKLTWAAQGFDVVNPRQVQSRRNFRHGWHYRCLEAPLDRSQGTGEQRLTFVCKAERMVRASAYSLLIRSIYRLHAVILYGGNFDAPISQFMGEQHANKLAVFAIERGRPFFVWDAAHVAGLAG
jgi:hypothetical protein